MADRTSPLGTRGPEALQKLLGGDAVAAQAQLRLLTGTELRLLAATAIRLSEEALWIVHGEGSR